MKITISFNLLMILISLTFFMIIFILFMLNLFLMLKTIKSREKMSPFECGFNQMSSARLPFSIHFYLITLLFLIFDIEIMLLLSSIFMMKIFNINMFLLLLFIFSIMLISLILEWMYSYLEWIF